MSWCLPGNSGVGKGHFSVSEGSEEGKKLVWWEWFCQAGAKAAEDKPRVVSGEDFAYMQMTLVYFCSLGSNLKGLFIYEGGYMQQIEIVRQCRQMLKIVLWSNQTHISSLFY